MARQSDPYPSTAYTGVSPARPEGTIHLGPPPDLLDQRFSHCFIGARPFEPKRQMHAVLLEGGKGTSLIVDQ